MAKAVYRNRKDWMILPGVEWIRPFPYASTRANIDAPQGTSVERKKDGLRIVLGHEVLYVPESVLKKTEEQNAEQSRVQSLDIVVMDAQRFLLALYGHRAEEYSLFCISRASGKVLWEARVWAEYPRISGIDFPQHVTNIQIANGVVYVFGLTDYSAYVEAFSAADGKSQFRFGTSY